MAAVAARGLTKSYAGTRALDHVDLELQEGELRGLLGANGAGKTTLLRILLGLVRPDGGSVEMLGHGVAGSPPGEGVAGFVEEPGFYPYLSGRGNLEVLAELDASGAEREIDPALAAVGLSARGADRVGGYSSGMRQRLSIAAALMRRPRVLLLDEPTTGLDPAGAREVGELLRALAGDGVAVLVSSHQIGELEQLCESFSVLSAGRLVWSGAASEMRARASASSWRLATSADERALELAADHGQLGAARGADGALSVRGSQQALDSFVLALAADGVAVRSLQLAMGPLETMFFELTGATA